MGLDATIRCRCFEEDATDPLPFPREWLAVDDQGGLVLRPEHETPERFWQLRDWMNVACAHAGMDLVVLAIGEWDDVYRFRDSLARDPGRFGVLLAELPVANGGALEPSLCALALEELDSLGPDLEAGHAGVVEALRTVLGASVATGNPVRWW